MDWETMSLWKLFLASQFARKRTLWIACVISGVTGGSNLLGLTGSLFAQDEKLKQALAYRPTQADVDYEKPDDSTEGIVLENASLIKQVGFIVRDSNQRMLRRFVDTDNDRKIDTWAYYNQGIEVYRDIDTDADSKPDQFQWMGPSGTRLGLALKQDRIIDKWSRISAQEATQQAVEALKSKNQTAMQSLLLTQEELKGLDLEPEISNRVEARLKLTLENLGEQLKATNLPDTVEWLHFGASYPGSISSSKSNVIEVYDNVSAIIENGEENQQLLVGSMIRVGDAWRLIDMPSVANRDEVPIVGGIFFQTAALNTIAMNQTPGSTTDGLDSELLNDYQDAENAFREKADTLMGEKLSPLHANRSKALVKIALASSGEDRENWVKQYADVVSSSYQAGEYPDGLIDLETQVSAMQKASFEPKLVSYVKYRMLNAWYSRAAEKTEDLEDIQDQWRKKLNEFVTDFPASNLAPEALFQLANIDDYLGDSASAEKLYRRILADFPSATQAARARGAVTRLTCEGKTISLEGSTINNQSFQLSRLKGKTVLIHYWATWCGPCKAEFEDMKAMYTKYKSDGFEIVSISLDESRNDLVKYLKETDNLPWLHLYAEGGLEESPLAAQLGVIALPTMILVGADGNVTARGVSLQQVERELRKLKR